MGFSFLYYFLFLSAPRCRAQGIARHPHAAFDRSTASWCRAPFPEIAGHSDHGTAVLVPCAGDREIAFGRQRRENDSPFPLAPTEQPRQRLAGSAPCAVAMIGFQQDHRERGELVAGHSAAFEVFEDAAAQLYPSNVSHLLLLFFCRYGTTGPVMQSVRQALERKEATCRKNVVLRTLAQSPALHSKQDSGVRCFCCSSGLRAARVRARFARDPRLFAHWKSKV